MQHRALTSGGRADKGSSGRWVFSSLKWVRNRQPSVAQIDSFKYLSSLMFGKALKKQIHPHATRAGWMGNYIPSLGSNKRGDKVRWCNRLHDTKNNSYSDKGGRHNGSAAIFAHWRSANKSRNPPSGTQLDLRLFHSIPFQKKNPDISSKLDILSFPSGQS